ncbi:hypothetical protein CBM2599_B50477 [Cupriavidus taiwanensis]|uniref:Uncharacterized protein n=1 Tax=Cupriavidus taiwanensis TaxID=164546 RepID=A0A375D3K4_9BURK|nr:hypothetical protein CBM2600_B10512 [Cupriavidus taiwanensis]SOY96545.1 hypothetical protein CBM2599_B50477 [Cupriavidus taiwanensis]SPD68925.1 protein of unknown function [Cupriavidus taiwanensis]
MLPSPACGRRAGVRAGAGIPPHLTSSKHRPSPQPSPASGRGSTPLVLERPVVLRHTSGLLPSPARGRGAGGEAKRWHTVAPDFVDAPALPQERDREYSGTSCIRDLRNAGCNRDR